MKLFPKVKGYIVVDGNKSKIFYVKRKRIINIKKVNIGDEGLDNKSLFSNIIEQNHNSVQEIIVLIPSYKLYIRSLNLPLTARNKIEDIIRLQVFEELPQNQNDLDFIYYTYKDKKRINVIVYVTESNIIKQYHDLCQNIGLSLKAIIPFNTNYSYIFDNNIDREPVLYIDINENCYNFMYKNKHDIYFRACKNEANFKEELTKTRSYIKRKFDLKEDLILKMNGKKINNSNIAENIHEVEEKVYLEKLIKSWEKYKNNNFIHCLKKLSKKFKEKSYKFICLAIILILIMSGISFYFKYEMRKNHLKVLEAELNRISPYIKQTEILENNYNENNTKLKTLKKEVNNNYSYLPWIQELSNILNDDQKINKIIFAEDELKLITGEANSAANVLKKLSESNLFRKIHFIGSINKKRDKETFKIAGELIYDFK